MKNKLLIICGPTATGKTNLALRIAKLFGGELVSADSRQVYSGLDIGTGKDLPNNVKYTKTNSETKGYYLINGIKVWGYDLVNPTEEFSVANYSNIARLIVKDIWKRNKLPILEGGTGLYIKGVVDGIETSHIPKDNKLRKNYENKKPDELFEILAQIDSVKAASLNESDKNNPRRLIRSIEIGLSNKKNVLRNNNEDFEVDTLWVGLKSNKDKLYKRIEKRVLSRVEAGIEEEINGLLLKGVTWKNQSMTGIGYRQWWKYHADLATKKEVVDEWIKEEKKYTKRQINWFRRDKRINWYDTDNAKCQKNVEKLIGKWYKRSDDAKKN